MLQRTRKKQHKQDGIYHSSIELDVLGWAGLVLLEHIIPLLQQLRVQGKARLTTSQFNSSKL